MEWTNVSAVGAQWCYANLTCQDTVLEGYEITCFLSLPTFQTAVSGQRLEQLNLP